MKKLLKIWLSVISVVAIVMLFYIIFWLFTALPYSSITKLNKYLEQNLGENFNFARVSLLVIYFIVIVPIVAHYTMKLTACFVEDSIYVDFMKKHWQKIGDNKNKQAK